MLVVVLLGIVAAIGLPKLNSSLDETQISGAAREVTAALEYAKTSAMSSYGQTRVTFDAAADTVIVERAKADEKLLGASKSLAETEVESVTFTPMQYPMKRGTNYMINLAKERRFGGTEISAVNFGGNSFVIFDEFGTPSDGGTVTLTLGTLRITVTLDGQTGKFTRSVVTKIG
jgi:Tfp pilus assembly protein FimT